MTHRIFKGIPRTLLFVPLLAAVLSVHAAGVTLPPPAERLDGLSAATVTVAEPHLSTALKPVEVSYRGFPATVILDHLLGDRWRAPDAVVGFVAKDGYLSMISAQRLLRYPAYLVYANANGDAFSVEAGPLDQLVQLGPWYLVWNNILHPELRADGATYWPYQVERVELIERDRLSKLYPPTLPEQYRAGAQLAQQYCLSCHQVNGVGGSKFPIDVAQWTAKQSFARFATWVLDPSGKNPLATMPPLAPEYPAAKRQLIARQIYGYLRAIGSLGY